MSYQNSYSNHNEGDYYYGSEIAIGFAFLILMSLICMCCDFEEPPDVYLERVLQERRDRLAASGSRTPYSRLEEVTTELNKNSSRASNSHTEASRILPKETVNRYSGHDFKQTAARQLSHPPSTSTDPTPQSSFNFSSYDTLKKHHHIPPEVHSSTKSFHQIARPTSLNISAPNSPHRTSRKNSPSRHTRASSFYRPKSTAHYPERRSSHPPHSSAPNTLMPTSPEQPRRLSYTQRHAEHTLTDFPARSVVPIRSPPCLDVPPPYAYSAQPYIAPVVTISTTDLDDIENYGWRSDYY
ncbi:uncharacterized protein [Chironomus tepperi]|uniref:uncharacterized protein n=1 Tax=Chironomus tepperi TaxID=113505 RepID=UPI00391F8D0D